MLAWRLTKNNAKSKSENTISCVSMRLPWFLCSCGAVSLIYLELILVKAVCGGVTLGQCFTNITLNNQCSSTTDHNAFVESQLAMDEWPTLGLQFYSTVLVLYIKMVYYCSLSWVWKEHIRSQFCSYFILFA